MSSYRKMQKEISAWWKTLTPEQKAAAPETVKRALSGGSATELAVDELFDQTMQQGKTMMTDAFDNMAYDMKYAVLERLQGQAAEIDELRPELERLKGLAGEWNDPNYPEPGFFMENCIAFWQAADKRDDVDALIWSQHRLNADWEVKDFFAQPGIGEYSGADIRTMLIERGFSSEAVHIDDTKTFKVPRSPGADGGLWRICDWGNAYYYKAMAHYAGVESVAITNLGTIIGVEERVRTAGADGVVARFPRTYVSDPGNVLPREWNNSIIWPDPHDYTEIRF